MRGREAERQSQREGQAGPEESIVRGRGRGRGAEGQRDRDAKRGQEILKEVERHRQRTRGISQGQRWKQRD